VVEEVFVDVLVIEEMEVIDFDLDDQKMEGQMASEIQTDVDPGGDQGVVEGEA